MVSKSLVDYLLGPSKASTLERKFVEAWVEADPDVPPFDREFQFAKLELDRKWRIDFAWPQYLFGVELDGGVFTGGGHGRGGRMLRDYEKQRAAIKLGWRILRYNTRDLTKKNIPGVIAEVCEVLGMIRGKRRKRRVQRAKTPGKNS